MIEIESYLLTNNLVVAFLLLSTIILYAEIHYKPRFLRGILYRKQPEIIFDIPQRIETDFLPVALIIKDSQKFPIEIHNIRIDIFAEGRKVATHQFQEQQNISTLFYNKLYTINISEFSGSRLKVKCHLKCHINNKEHTIVNNNYPFMKNKQLQIFIDSDKRPALPGWKWGDLHCHSHYTEDQVEFGLPLELIPPVSSAMGISFVAITDHSYDLDDAPDSWTGSDPELTKWHNMRREIKKINTEYNNFLLLPGEEVSTDNGDGKTVHMLIINAQKYYPGSGDSFENGVFQNSELNHEQILAELPADALAIAAHPFEKPSGIQSFFLKRGIWNSKNGHPKLSGYQILNGKQMSGFRQGKKEWIKKLLQQNKKYIYAGNDSHGFLNKFISVNAPLLSLNNSQRHIFGEMLTAVKNTNNEIDNLIKGLKTNPVIISNGPALEISIFRHSPSNQYAEIGGTLNNRPDRIRIKAESNPYFGKINRIENYISDYSSQKEHLINTFKYNGYNFDKEISITNLPEKGYIRSVVKTTKDKFALTNPVWFNIHHKNQSQ